MNALRLRNQATGRYLRSNYRGEIYTGRSYYGFYKVWIIHPSNDGWYFLRNKRTGLYLEGHPHSFYAYSTPFKDNDYQKW